MGLNNHADLVLKQDHSIQEIKKKSGLLNKVNSLSAYDLVFSTCRDLYNALKAERAGLLCPSEEGFSILLFSIGFDLTTSRRFCPKIDLLNEMIANKNDWNIISGSALEQYKTFFSSREQESLSAIYILPISYMKNITWYLIVADSMLNVFRQKCELNKAADFFASFLNILSDNINLISALSFKSAINQSLTSIKNHVESAFALNRIATLACLSFSNLFDKKQLLTDIETQSVYYAIIHKIMRQAGTSNIIFLKNNFDVHIVLFSTVSIDTDLYFFQLMKPLEKLFGFQRISHIQTKNLGICNSINETMDFLTGEV